MLAPAFLYLCNMKTCYKCKVDKAISEFSKDKRSKDGLQSGCKSCHSDYFKKNKERFYEAKKKYREENKEVIAEQRKRYAKENKDTVKASRKAYYEKNKEHMLAQNKEYYLQNRDIKLQYIKDYRSKNKSKINERDRLYMFNRRQEDPVFRLKCNIRGRLHRYCKHSGLNKRFKTMDSVGLSPADFKVYIESMFLDGMTWDNYGQGEGKWSIDHTKPLCTANTEEDVFTLNHYTNLRPMWWFDNLAKGGKYEEQ